MADEGDEIMTPYNLIEKKPRFYISDLNNYNEDFLKEIILWQNEYIKALQLEAENENRKN